MENKIVEAINYIKKISKMKLSVDRLLAHSNNTIANNWDRICRRNSVWALHKICNR